MTTQTDENNMYAEIALLKRDVSYHKDEIRRLDLLIQETGQALFCIQKTLEQIKWIIVGGAFYAMATETGIIEAIKIAL